MLKVKNIIEVENLSYSYAKLQVLKKVNFIIPEKNEIIGLLGPNGAGKTTLINILSTILTLQEGRVKLFGFDLKKEVNKIRPLLGIIPQKNKMLDFNMTVFDNLYFYAMLNGHRSKRDVLEVLELFDLLEVRNKILMQLSGGTLRKLMLARLAFATDCRLLFLDEPTTGIDIYGKRAFYQSLIQMQSDLGIKIIVTTHDLQEAEELCDRVLIINDGQMIENVSVSEIKNKSCKKVIVKFEGQVDHKEIAQIREIKPKSISLLADGSLTFLLNREFAYGNLAHSLEKVGSINSLTIDQISLKEHFKYIIEESS